MAFSFGWLGGRLTGIYLGYKTGGLEFVHVTNDLWQYMPGGKSGLNFIEVKGPGIDDKVV